MSSKTKRALTVAGVVVMTGGLLVGCGSSSSSTSTGSTNTTSNSSGGSSAGKKVTITWAIGSITHDNLNQQLVAGFEKAHPNITVKIQPEASNTDTTRQQLTTAIGAGATTPDVYLGDVVWPAQFGSNNLAQPLNKLFPQSFWNRFSPGLVQGATYNNNIYAAPFFVDTAFLFYRKDLLKKAGLPVPTTWEQLQSDAQTLQKKNLVKYGFIWQGDSYEGLTCDFTEYLADAGGQVLNSSGQPVLSSAAGNKAVSFMRSLITSGVTPNAVTTDQENQSMNLFEQGQVAFLRNWSYAWTDSQSAAQSKVVGKVGVVVLPTFAGESKHYSSVGGWDLYVNPHSKNLQADETFIDWLTGPEAQKILVEHGELPTNAAVAKEASSIGKSPIFGLLPQVSYISRPSQSPNYPQLSQAIYSNINAALAGSASVSDALTKADSQMKSSSSNTGL
ncbi:ABC transporter substrate-binding protein [Alicyclobacillus fastidiosus]|uniref:ABC transporter substrate-binding protein n=1 Tax=Alicyclobacillus fastidiosus TaxID=392011 RepID=A0ABV5AL96_9BACL|nr:ABC transporter substrate-binding protein [Alicyclobacillus fastidiosus]WEH10178.1 ABC transporter substrate-binding protein [Alicyclobacillus fastidiosus]